MNNATRRVFNKYVAVRFSDKDPNDPYFRQWEKRFEDGWEWQYSDYAGRKVLQDIAPDTYPVDKDEFFHRKMDIDDCDNCLHLGENTCPNANPNDCWEQR